MNFQFRVTLGWIWILMLVAILVISLVDGIDVTVQKWLMVSLVTFVLVTAFIVHYYNGDLYNVTDKYEMNMNTPHLSVSSGTSRRRRR